MSEKKPTPIDIHGGRLADVINILVTRPATPRGSEILAAAKACGSDAAAALLVEMFIIVGRADHGQVISLTIPQRAVIAGVMSSVICQFDGVQRLAGKMLDGVREAEPDAPAVLESTEPPPHP